MFFASLFRKTRCKSRKKKLNNHRKRFLLLVFSSTAQIFPPYDISFPQSCGLTVGATAARRIDVSSTLFSAAESAASIFGIRKCRRFAKRSASYRFSNYFREGVIRRKTSCRHNERRAFSPEQQENCVFQAVLYVITHYRKNGYVPSMHVSILQIHKSLHLQTFKNRSK